MGRDAAAEETVVDQLHRLLVEVKDHLEDSETRKGQKLLGKVELVLESWDDDAFFAEGDEDDAGEDGTVYEDDEDDYDDDLEDDEDDEGSILDEVLDDEEDEPVEEEDEEDEDED